MSAPVSIQGAGHAAAHHAGAATPSQQMPVQPPRRSFFAAVRAWLGGGERARLASAGRAASHVASLRPPTTGRFGAFFGRYRTVSADQIKSAQEVHSRLRDGARKSISAVLPDSVRECLHQVASRHPDQIFDAVCALWTGQAGEQVQGVPKAVETLLRHQDPAITQLALASALRKANRWQTSGQVNARAQAAYAALVGSASAHQTRGEAQLADIERGAGKTETLADRSRQLASLRAEIASLPLGAGHALRVRCDQVAAGLRKELMEAVRAQAGGCQAMRLDAPDAECASRQQALNALQQAMDTCPGWPAGELAQGTQLLAAAQDDLTTWQQSQATIQFYKGLLDRNPDTGHERAPCKSIAQLLRGGTVADYRHRQGQIDRICAKAPADQHLDALAALGVGITGSDGAAKVTLLDELARGERQLVDQVFPGAEWDDLAGALKQDGLAHRERADLAGAQSNDDRQNVGERFRRERFATERQHQLRVLNREINRLRAAAGADGAALLGDAGRTPEANEAAIAEILRSSKGLAQDADVLLLNWIYYSSLDAQTLEVDQDKAARLWTALGTGRDLPAFKGVQQQLGQGFRSLGDAARADRMLGELARKLPASKALAAASQAQDARVAARGIARDLVARICGNDEEVDLDQPEQVEARVKSAVEQAKREAADEQAVPPRAVAQRQRLFDELAGRKWKLALDADVRHGSQLRALLDCLDSIEQIESVKKTSPASAATRTRELMPKLAQLEGFDPDRRSFGAGAGAAPSYGKLKNLLEDREHLRKWLKASDEAHRLQAESPASGPKTRALAEVMEAATRVAILQEGAAVGDSFRTKGKDDPQGPAKAVLKRLARMGLSAGPDQPAVVRQHLEAVLGKMQEKDRDLPKLSKRFDPADPKAKGFLQAAIPGHPDGAGPQGVVARVRGYMDAEALKLREQNRRAVEERFKALQVGQSFSLEVGRASQVTGGYSLVPGVSVSGEARGEQASGIRVSRTEAGYEIRVMDTRAVGLAGVLSLLGDTVSGRLGRTQSKGEGFVFTCADAGQALLLVEGVAGGAAPATSQLGGVKVQAVRSQASQTRAQLQAQAGLSLPGDQQLFQLESQLAAEWGDQVEVLRSPFVERQRRTATRTVLASGGVSVLNGKWSADAERGYELGITRVLTRRGTQLVGPQTLAIRARVVDGDASASLLRVMPHLQDKAENPELNHYLAQIAALQTRDAEAPTTGAASVVEVELECALTAQARHRVNGWYRHAESAGTAKPKDAAHAMGEAERLLHDPESYTPRTVRLVRRWTTEASTGQTSYHQSLARVSAEERLDLQGLPGQASQNATLPAAYAALVGRAPANDAAASRLRTGSALAA